MRTRFRGEFGETPESLKNIWKDAIFVFDANILLNFYRYSDSSRKEFLNVLSEFKERVWLPSRAAEEYFNNRLSEISTQASSYSSAQDSIDSIKKEFGDPRRHPFISEETMEKLDSVIGTIKSELTENKKAHDDRISNDEIMQSIADIFDNRLGEPYSEDRLDKVFADGASRYLENIPPGYMDKNKVKDPKTRREKCKNFGDLIVWLQTIDMAAAQKVNVIFVTDDGKEDWWLKAGGKTLGPRPELIDEFSSLTNKVLHMYKPDQFLKYANEHLKQNVSTATLEEVRETSQSARRIASGVDASSKVSGWLNHRPGGISPISLSVALENWLSQIFHITGIQYDKFGYDYVFSTFENPMSFGVKTKVFGSSITNKEVIDSVTECFDKSLDPKGVDEVILVLISDDPLVAKDVGHRYHSFFRGASDKMRVVVGVAKDNPAQGFCEFYVISDTK